MKKDCRLTALWQCGVDIIPKWRMSSTPLHCIFSLVLCGLCKETVTPTDFSGFEEDLERSTNRPLSDFNVVLAFYDISDGFWIDPRSPGKITPEGATRVRMPNSIEDYRNPKQVVEIQDVDLFKDT
jgi:hypothetical protein